MLDSGESKVYLWLNGYRIAWTEVESADLTALEFSDSCLEAEIQEPSVTTKYEVWLSGYGDAELREGSGEWTEVM